MNKRWVLLFGVLLGGMAGWLLQYFQVFRIQDQVDFWLGILVATTTILVFLILMNLPSAERPGRRWIPLTVITLIVGGLLIGLITNTQLDKGTAQLAASKVFAEIEAEQILARQQANLGQSVTLAIADLMDEALWVKGAPSKDQIDRFVNLSRSFQPYRYLAGDTLMSRRLSPERGQLLFALQQATLPDSVLDVILRLADFSNSDAAGMDLTSAYLKGAMLKEANFREADLEGAVLDNARIQRATFDRSNLENASLDSADLRRTSFSWANLSNASIQASMMEGAILSHTIMPQINMSHSIFQWGDLRDAFMENAVLERVDFMKTKVDRTDFRGSDFSFASLIRIPLTEVNLEDCNLTGVAILDKEWFENLPEWKVLGAEAILDSYEFAEDTIKRYSNFMLVPRS